MTLNDVTINAKETIYDALIKIDNNHLGFVIAIDDDNKVLATLTDGDIRRHIIKGGALDASVAEAYRTDFTSITIDDEFNDVIDIFKDGRIKFIPVINSDGSLANVIPKASMHALLLRDMHPTLTYNYLDVDGSLIDYEIFQRPWGFYKTTILNDLFQSKIISVLPNGSLSLQLHHRREEHWIIVSGNAEVQVGESTMEVQGGTHIFIPKGCKHRLTNLSNTDSLILIEVQCGDYFGEDDIERFDDIYGRV